MSSPQSKICICNNLALTNDYQHTIYFKDLASQKAYFTGKVVKTFPNYTYVRRSWNIKVEANKEETNGWSYLFFQNVTNGKIYYYFINSVEYLNDHTVELSLEMDVLQTYMFDYELLPCFVEREHSETDEPGDNLVDEGLELGEYVYENSGSIDLRDMSVLMLSTINPEQSLSNGKKIIAYGDYIEGVYSGIGLYKINGTTEQIQNLFWALDQQGWSDCVVALWMYPTALIDDGEETNRCERVIGSKYKEKSFSRPNSLDGYYPANNKLLTYPYCLLYVTGYTGSSASYRYEEFNNPEECTLRVVGSITPNSGTKIYPLRYKNTTHNYEEGVNGTTFPSCAWAQDVYKMWLAQNESRHTVAQANAQMDIVAGGVSAVVGLFTGNAGAGIGQMASGAKQIADLMAQKKDMSVQPPQAKGSCSININVSNGYQGYLVQPKTIKFDQAWKLDDYFTMYGYKCMNVKVPNTHVRERWTYCKTVNCLIKGNLCTDDKRKIQALYDNGLTTWVNGDEIGSYHLSNKCIGGEK